MKISPAVMPRYIDCNWFFPFMEKSNGTRAIQARSSMSNNGKARARRTPERAARKRSFLFTFALFLGNLPF